jgi:hypothetical protein
MAAPDKEKQRHILKYIPATVAPEIKLYPLIAM